MTNYEICIYMDKHSECPERTFVVDCCDDEEAFALAEYIRQGYQAKFATAEICWHSIAKK